MSKSRQSVVDEAVAWHLGLEAAGADEWRRFVAWLEADPIHAEAYDRLTMADAEIPAAAFPAAPMVPVVVPGRSNLRWLRLGGVGGGLVAAAVAAWLAVLPAVMGSPSYAIETAPGERRATTLPDGTQVRLNGATRLVLDRDTPRLATLDRGEAVFTVVHDADQPFEVRAGDVTLRDVGTVFDVARAEGRLRVAVAEGEVLFQPKREKVALTAGMTLALAEADARVTVGRTDAATVGGWAEGHLDYQNAPLATVAEDVARSTGAHIQVASAMAAQPFTGTLRTDRPVDKVLKSFAALAGGELHRDGPGWTMTPRSEGVR